MKSDEIYQLVGTVLSWSLGYLGADRFYKGDIGLGVLKLVTLGAFGIWWLVDACIWTNNLGHTLRGRHK